MLMIVGLVLFIIISLVLYLSKSAVKKQSQQSIKKTQETAIEVQPIKEFVTKCVDKLAKDAIILVGKQGGHIYSSQGGTLVDYQDTDEGLFFVRHDAFNVAYNILPPKFALPPHSSEIPDYPWQTFPYRTSASNVEVFDGFFGISNIPPLNSSEGPNSLQAQIGYFIDNGMPGCAKLDIFQRQGLEIAMEKPATSVTIGSGHVSVQTRMPVKITNPATKEFAELSDFSASMDIRLRDIYFFAKDLIENDIQNIKFNISSRSNNKDFFRIRLAEDIFQKDDLITIIDDKSLIYGKPYEYTFARRNRAPALYYIRKINLELPHNFEVTREALLKDYQLKAEDPDEDSYTFSINPVLPKKLDIPQINFRVEVSDGQFSDYQIITVTRK